MNLRDADAASRSLKKAIEGCQEKLLGKRCAAFVLREVRKELWRMKLDFEAEDAIIDPRVAGLRLL